MTSFAFLQRKLDYLFSQLKPKAVMNQHQINNKSKNIEGNDAEQ